MGCAVLEDVHSANSKIVARMKLCGLCGLWFLNNIGLDKSLPEGSFEDMFVICWRGLGVSTFQLGCYVEDFAAGKLNGPRVVNDDLLA